MTEQEALNNLIQESCPKRVSCDECKINYRCNCEAKGYIDILQKLIDHSTSKKPILVANEGFDIDVSSNLCCPNCKQPIINVWSKREYRPNYCHYCGQAILWEENL